MKNIVFALTLAATFFFGCTSNTYNFEVTSPDSPSDEPNDEPAPAPNPTTPTIVYVPYPVPVPATPEDPVMQDADGGPPEPDSIGIDTAPIVDAVPAPDASDGGNTVDAITQPATGCVQTYPTVTYGPGTSVSISARNDGFGLASRQRVEDGWRYVLRTFGTNGSPLGEWTAAWSANPLRVTSSSSLSGTYVQMQDDTSLFTMQVVELAGESIESRPQLTGLYLRMNGDRAMFYNRLDDCYGINIGSITDGFISSDSVRPAYMTACGADYHPPEFQVSNTVMGARGPAVAIRYLDRDGYKLYLVVLEEQGSIAYDIGYLYNRDGLYMNINGIAAVGNGYAVSTTIADGAYRAEWVHYVPGGFGNAIVGTTLGDSVSKVRLAGNGNILAAVLYDGAYQTNQEAPGATLVRSWKIDEGRLAPMNDVIVYESNGYAPESVDIAASGNTFGVTAAQPFEYGNHVTFSTLSCR
jgi:hypothetical protein